MPSALGDTLIAGGRAISDVGSMVFQQGMRKYDEFKKSEMLKMETNYNIRLEALKSEMELNPPLNDDETSMDMQQIGDYYVRNMREIGAEIGKTGAIEDIRNTFSDISEQKIQRQQPVIASIFQTQMINREVQTFKDLKIQEGILLDAGKIKEATISHNDLKDTRENHPYLGDNNGPNTVSDKVYQQSEDSDFLVRGTVGVVWNKNGYDYDLALNALEEEFKANPNASTQDEKIKMRLLLDERANVDFSAYVNDLEMSLARASANGTLDIDTLGYLVRAKDNGRGWNSTASNALVKTWLSKTVKKDQSKKPNIDILQFFRIFPYAKDREAFDNAMNSIGHLYDIDSLKLLNYNDYKTINSPELMERLNTTLSNVIFPKWIGREEKDLSKEEQATKNVAISVSLQVLTDLLRKDQPLMIAMSKNNQSEVMNRVNIVTDTYVGELNAEGVIGSFLDLLGLLDVDSLNKKQFRKSDIFINSIAGQTIINSSATSTGFGVDLTNLKQFVTQHDLQAVNIITSLLGASKDFKLGTLENTEVIPFKDGKTGRFFIPTKMLNEDFGKMSSYKNLKVNVKMITQITGMSEEEIKILYGIEKNQDYYFIGTDGGKFNFSFFDRGKEQILTNKNARELSASNTKTGGAGGSWADK